MSECAAHLFLQEHMQTGSLKNPVQNSLVFFAKSKTKRLQNKAVILTLQDVYGAAFRKPQLGWRGGRGSINYLQHKINVPYRF